MSAQSLDAASKLCCATLNAASKLCFATLNAASKLCFATLDAASKLCCASLGTTDQLHRQNLISYSIICISTGPVPGRGRVCGSAVPRPRREQSILPAKP
ncbi:uncharacterized protein BKA55DRAFT_581220 [Fusarium redolens]|uniref:Uncharacterized protein n=1 Tax=Fusarium redolens TaxID=48865 RepID=A0A9P9G1R9_FUSRE|nr:uncharacterized protein BKA55DRAFT_581220 [Fusarium redolens]KAH7231640.1 hypothetical protein BKA55DRAFT_581220 [Fusarium redolens]